MIQIYHRIFVLFTSMIVVCSVTFPQSFPNNFDFSATNSSVTFTSISDGTSLGANGYEDATIIDVSLPFTFSFNGTGYSKIGVCSSGWISFNTGIQTSDHAYNGDLSNPSPHSHTFWPLVAPLFGRLVINGDIYTKTNGSSPNRTFTIEWNNVMGDANSSGNAISFQVILYESTGVIQFVYTQGDGTTLNTGGTGGSQGPSIGLDDGSSVPLNFISVSAFSNSASKSTSTVANPISVPSSFSNLMFTFTPNPALPVEATNFLASANDGSVTLTWRTQTEVSNAGFNILREDPGMSSFSQIANFNSDDRLRGAGTSTAPKSYSFTDNNVISGAGYKYKIQSVSTTGVTEDVSTLSVFVDVPKSYEVYQNYPNPFNPSTTIRFDLSQPSNVTLEVCNVLGQRVVDESKGLMNAGRYNENIDLSHSASGVYYYRITALGANGERFVSMKKMMLIK